MQGVVHWMGLRDCYFAAYPLTEGAIVAELCNLIAASLPSDLKLSPEFRIEELTGVKQSGKGRREAVDLVIERRSVGRPIPPLFCIEVKRWKKGSYEEDIDKLQAAKAARNGTWRGFVLVVAQGSRPDALVTEKGLARRRGKMSTKAGSEFLVRRVCKALHTLKADSTTGYWACLLEVS
jgi:hypothetical protein